MASYDTSCRGRCPLAAPCGYDSRGAMKKIILIAGLMISLATHGAHAQEKIRVGQGSISLQSGLMHIAKDRGLFAKYGLVTETIYIPGGSTNIHVLISGNLDLSQLSGAPGVAANL